MKRSASKLVVISEAEISLPNVSCFNAEEGIVGSADASDEGVIWPSLRSSIACTSIETRSFGLTSRDGGIDIGAIHVVAIVVFWLSAGPSESPHLNQYPKCKRKVPDMRTAGTYPCGSYILDANFLSFAESSNRYLAIADNAVRDGVL